MLRLSKVLCDVSFTIGRRLRLWSSSAIGSGRGLLFGIFMSLAGAGGRAACRRSALNVRSGCFCCCRLGLREVLPLLLHLSAYWLDPRCLCEDCLHRLVSDVLRPLLPAGSFAQLLGSVPRRSRGHIARHCVFAGAWPEVPLCAGCSLSGSCVGRTSASLGQCLRSCSSGRERRAVRRESTPLVGSWGYSISSRDYNLTRFNHQKNAIHLGSGMCMGIIEGLSLGLRLYRDRF